MRAFFWEVRNGRFETIFPFRTTAIMWLLLLLAAFPDPWPPRFDSRDVTNSTLQKAFATHPPLKDWLRRVINGGRQEVTWASVDDLLIDYVQSTRRALFINDIVTIDAEDQLLNARSNDDVDDDFEYKNDLKQRVHRHKEARARMDPNGHNTQ